MNWLPVALAALSAVPARAASVTGVSVGAAGARIALDAPVEYRAFRLSEPERFVVDLRGAALGVPERAWPGAGPVRGVRAAPHPDLPGAVRVVFDLAAPLDAGTRDAAGGLLVEFGVPLPAAEEAPEPEPEAAPDAAPADFKDALAPLALPGFAHRPAAPGRPGPAALPRRLEAVEALPEAVHLALTGPAEPSVQLLPAPPRLVLDFPGVEAGARFPTARPAPGGTVVAVRAASRGRLTRVVLELSKAAPYSLSPRDGGLSVVFEGEPAAPAAATREYRGWVVDGSGRPLDGVFLVRFSVPDEGAPAAARWSENLYVDARGGRFSAVLGRTRPLPAGARAPNTPLDAAAPPGVAWRVVPR